MKTNHVKNNSTHLITTNMILILYIKKKIFEFVVKINLYR